MEKFPMKIAAGTVILIAVVLSLGGRFYVVQRQHLKHQAEMSILAVANMKANEIANWRSERLSNANVMSQSPRLRKAIKYFLESTGPEARLQLDDRFSNLKRNYKYQDILVVDTRGNILFSMTGHLNHKLKPLAMKNLSVALGTQKPLMSDIHLDDDKPHVETIVPIVDNKVPIAAVVLHCEASQYLYPLIETWPTPSETAETSLVRPDGGSVLYLNELRLKKDTALKLRIPLSDKEVTSVMAARGMNGVVEGKDYRGAKVLAAIKHIPGTPWAMVAKIDESEALYEWKGESTLIMGLMMAMVSFMVAGAGFAVQRTERKYFKSLYLVESGHREHLERFRITLMSIGDAVIATDAKGQIIMLNPVAERLMGWKQEEVAGKPICEVFNIINEETRQPAENPVRVVASEGVVAELPEHTVLISRDGTETPIADSAAPILDETGKIMGVALVFRDQTNERLKQDALERSELLLRKRLDLIEYAMSHSLKETLQKTLDILGNLFESPIGFYYFVEPGQRRLSLQAWSTKTVSQFCNVKGEGMHHEFDLAGMWADCIKECRTVIHNDYDSAPHRKGLPDGHPPVTRFLVTPVMRNDAVVAVLGIGNKPARYTENDGDFISFLADVSWELVELKKTQEALRDSEDTHRALFNAVTDAVFVHEVDEEGMPGAIQVVNDIACELLGYSRDELLNLRFTDLDALPPDDDKTAERKINPGKTGLFEHVQKAKDGRLIPVEINTRCLTMGGKPLALSVVRDITGRKRFEEEARTLQAQLFHSQKMEAVGHLAGGVAHNFNNMLAIISSAAEMAGLEIDENSPAQEDLWAISSVAKDAGELTLKLLTFSRKNDPCIRSVNAREIVDEVRWMLSRAMPKNIAFQTSMKKDVVIRCDRNQIQQALVNICNNAVDAMPAGGRLIIEAEEAQPPEDACSDFGEKLAGRYLLIKVTDTGVGMTKETLSKATEPFYTTKGMGKGTGLGLSVTQGAIQSNRGDMRIDSEFGKGTCVRIYLPIDEKAVTPEEEPTEIKAHTGNETILIVDDEGALLKISEKYLARNGYKPLVANNGAKALEMYARHGDEIAVVLLDIMMPGMDGAEVSRRLQEMDPGVKIVFSSGFGEAGADGRLPRDINSAFIQKPYRMVSLCRAIRGLIDSKA